MLKDKITSNMTDVQICEWSATSEQQLGIDEFFLRDIENAEIELDEFYLILSGKYAKRMRQLFSSIEKELLELN